MSSRPSFAKRQKEQARREKRLAKLARAQQRRKEKQLSPAAGDDLTSSSFASDLPSDVNSDLPSEETPEEPAGS